MHSKDEEIMSTFIEWDRSAFEFMKDGLPRNSEERAGMDDDILRNLPREEQENVIREVRLLASWTKMHKALDDIKHRVDIAQLESPNFNADPYTLFKLLISRDEELQSVMKSQSETSIVAPEQACEWLWYASDSPAQSTIAPTKTATSEKARPPIELYHVRLLLPHYLEMVGRALKTSKETPIV